MVRQERYSSVADSRERQNLLRNLFLSLELSTHIPVGFTMLHVSQNIKNIDLK